MENRMHLHTLGVQKKMTSQIDPAFSVEAPKPTDQPTSLKQYEEASKISEEHLATFDTLDFDVFSGQDWDRLKESHATNVTVYWPDGHATQGIEKHIADMKVLFAYAPDTRIKVHSVK